MTGLLLLILIAQPLVGATTDSMQMTSDGRMVWVHQVDVGQNGSTYYVLQAGEPEGRTVYVWNDESEEKGD